MRQPSLSRTRAARAIMGATTAALVLAGLGAAPVAAKEGMAATLDRPIATGTPEGALIEVGLSVVVAGTDGDHPLIGSPVYLKLVGRGGGVSREPASTGRVPGHYSVQIPVPAGGVQRVEVGLHGTSDMPIQVRGTVLVAGPITATTAQLAPAPRGGATSGEAAVDAAPVVIAAPSAGTVPAAPAAAAPVTGGALSSGELLVGLLAALLAAAGALVVRRTRRSDAARLPGARGG